MLELCFELCKPGVTVQAPRERNRWVGTFPPTATDRPQDPAQDSWLLMEGKGKVCTVSGRTGEEHM